MENVKTNIKINVYDENDKVIKTVEANIVEFRFGTIRKLMKTLKVDDIDNTTQLLGTVYTAWEELTEILNKCFPGMTDDDWDNVKISELMPALMAIMKFSFFAMLTIPTSEDDSKN
jgi:hypothetical protein